MKASDLRNAILQLAIQGKLVPQDPKDEPASVLLERIKAEKERLVKAGKIKKEKPLPEITEEDKPFEIPESWEWCRINDLALIYTGNSIPEIVKTQKYRTVKEGYFYIGTKDVGFDSSINYENGVIIPFEESNFRVAPALSTLVCIEGGSAGRKVGLTDKDVCFGNKLCCISPVLMNEKFIFYFFRSSFFYKSFVAKIGGIIGGVGVNTFKSLYIPLPPLAEQQRIIAKIEEIMPKIDEYEKLEQELSSLEGSFLDNLRKSILQYAVQGKLVRQDPEDEPASVLLEQIKAEKEQLIKEGKIKKEKLSLEIADEEKLFEIPESWEWVRFGRIVINRDGERVPLSSVQRETMNKVYDYYGASGVIDKVENYIFDKRLLLIGEDGANLITRSKPIAFFAEGKYWVNNHAHVIDAGHYVDLEYIALFINSISLVKYVTGTAQPKMNQEKMNSIPVALPPFAEQQRIVEKVEGLMRLCDRLEDSI